MDPGRRTDDPTGDPARRPTDDTQGDTAHADRAGSGRAERGPLEMAAEAFAWLGRGPTPVRVPAVDGLPGGLGLRALGVRMVTGRLPTGTLAQAWAAIIERAQSEQRARGAGSTWAVVAVGLAVPELARVTARHGAYYGGHPADLEAAALTGWLTELHRTAPVGDRLAIGDAHGLPLPLLTAATVASARLADTLAVAGYTTTEDDGDRAGRADGPTPVGDPDPTDRTVRTTGRDAQSPTPREAPDEVRR